MFRDAARGVYKRIVLKDNKVLGIVLYGDVTDGAWFFDLLRRGTGRLRAAGHWPRLATAHVGASRDSGLRHG